MLKLKFYEKRRRIIIRDMTQEDIQKFYMQFFDWTDDQKKDAARNIQKQIKDICKKKEIGKRILLVTDNSGSKMIGKIEVQDLNDNSAKIDIQMPNRSLTMMYGDEVLDQFIKVCTEKRLYSKIYINKECSIVSNYMQKRETAVTDVINIA